MHRTRFTLSLLALTLLAAVPVASQVSAGIMLGEPTGLSGKLWLDQTSSVDIAVAWSFTGGGMIYLHADYQQHFDVIDIEKGRLPVFVGIGPKVYLGDEFTLGVRIPVGIVYEFASAPLELFAEIAPGMLLFPATRLDGSAGVGVRYRFGGSR